MNPYVAFGCSCRFSGRRGGDRRRGGGYRPYPSDNEIASAAVTLHLEWRLRHRDRSQRFDWDRRSRGSIPRTEAASFLSLSLFLSQVPFSAGGNSQTPRDRLNVDYRSGDNCVSDIARFDKRKTPSLSREREREALFHDVGQLENFAARRAFRVNSKNGVCHFFC